MPISSVPFCVTILQLFRLFLHAVALDFQGRKALKNYANMRKLKVELKSSRFVLYSISIFGSLLAIDLFTTIWTKK